jgi:hypothetical protein
MAGSELRKYRYVNWVIAERNEGRGGGIGVLGWKLAGVVLRTLREFLWLGEQGGVFYLLKDFPRGCGSTGDNLELALCAHVSSATIISLELYSLRGGGLQVHTEDTARAFPVVCQPDTHMVVKRLLSAAPMRSVGGLPNADCWKSRGRC